MPPKSTTGCSRLKEIRKKELDEALRAKLDWIMRSTESARHGQVRQIVFGSGI
jgi:hypothetical protein